MEMFEDDSFKLQEMIDSDMRSQLDVLIPRTDIPDNTPTLTDLAPVDPMETDLSTSTEWIALPQQLYTFSMDMETMGSLLVNPQTGMPLTLASISASSPVVTTTVSDTGQGQGGQSLHMTHILPDSPSDPRQIDLTTPSQSPQNIPTITLQQSRELADQKAKMVKNRIPSGSRDTTNPVVQSSTDRVYPKPGYSYSCLIAMALKNSKTGSLPVNEIYNFMTENFPYFKTAPNGWKNSVRHNLSLNKCFEKIEKPSGNGTPKKGCLWAMNPAKVDKMDEELHKWSSKDPGAIRLSMANPEKLELLEKGELKDEDENEEEESPVVSSTDDMPEERVVKMEATSSSDMTYDPNMQLDESLQGLELQKGIWDDLDDERLQFLGETLSSSSSSPHHGNQSDTSLSAAVSFIQCNYIYSQAQSSSELPSLDCLTKSEAATNVT